MFHIYGIIIPYAVLMIWRPFLPLIGVAVLDYVLDFQAKVEVFGFVFWFSLYVVFPFSCRFKWFSFSFFRFLIVLLDLVFVPFVYGFCWHCCLLYFTFVFFCFSYPLPLCLYFFCLLLCTSFRINFGLLPFTVGLVESLGIE